MKILVTITLLAFNLMVAHGSDAIDGPKQPEPTKPNRDEYFTVYTRNDFGRTQHVDAYAVFKANQNEIPILAGRLPKVKTSRPEYNFKSEDNGTSFVQEIAIADHYERNLAFDQYIEVTFNDEATVRYTQPRWGKVVRDRVDIWRRAGRGIFTKNGHYLKDQPLSYYPEQLLIKRPRRGGDDQWDVDYTGKAYWQKSFVVGGTVITGAVLMGVATAGLAGYAGGMAGASFGGTLLSGGFSTVGNPLAGALFELGQLVGGPAGVLVGGSGGLIGGAMGGAAAGRMAGGAIVGDVSQLQPITHGL